MCPNEAVPIIMAFWMCSRDRQNGVHVMERSVEIRRNSPVVVFGLEESGS